MKLFSFVLGFMLLVGMFSANAQVHRYERDFVRAQMTHFLSNPLKRTLIIKGENQNPQAMEFLRYYRDVVDPKIVELENLILRYRAYNILIDSASQLDEKEFEKWSGKDGEFGRVAAEYNQWAVDDTWTAILKEWARLSAGLEGPLPEYARRMMRERELEAFPPEMKATLDEVEHLQQEYMVAVNKAPSAATLADYQAGMSGAARKFMAGEISFEQATQDLITVFQKSGTHFVGYEAVQAKGENLNKMAILRSQLAKSKGFATWTDYALELSGQGYSPQYRGAANQRAFLKKYLTLLQPLRDRFVELRLAELGLPLKLSDLRYHQLSLLALPNLKMIKEHFPKEKVTDIWEEVLLESGFSREILSQIVVDDSARDGKFRSGAYLSGFQQAYLEQVEVDAQNLSVLTPPVNAPGSIPGFAYIMQTYKGEGVTRDLETAFHEGGHALEKLLKLKPEITDEAYGYVEVPSMTSERFTHDPLLLWNKAVAINGKKPTLAEITTLVENSSKNEIMGLIGMASQALFDIELWGYDYSAPGAKTYLERVKEVSEAVDRVTGAPPIFDSPVPFYYFYVGIPHFVSGNVRNIGYTYAEIASRMMTTFLSDELEKQTGRRSWYQQPGLAALMTEKFFQQGWRTTFPESIEAITGHKFSPEDVVAQMERELDLDGCEARLLK
ncbi:MAG: M3 family metallopeptidase [Bdellovibrionales bacterium]